MADTRILLRRWMDACMRLIPRAVHTGLLKTYGRHPELAVGSGFGVYPQTWLSPLVNPSGTSQTKLLGPRPFWGGTNEQYAVEALLTGGDRYEVAVPCHLIGRERRDLAELLFPSSSDRGQAIWLRKIG